jgi:hypothetical protein
MDLFYGDHVSKITFKYYGKKNLIFLDQLYMYLI